MPPQNASHRRKKSQPRHNRIFVVVLALLVGVVICAAAASAAARLREAAQIRDRASQSLTEAVKTAQLDDTTPPTRPKRLALMNAMPTSVTVSWRRSYDNVGVAGYKVYLFGRPTMRTTGTTYTIESLACGTTYRVGVVAHDATGNDSRSAWISVSTASCAPPQPPADTQPPAKPILSLGPATQTTLELRWQAGIDNVGVHHYNVFRGKSATAGDQVKIAETTALSYVYTQLACGTSYSLALQAQDAAGNKSNLAEAIWYPVTTRACDQPPPPPPPPAPPAGDTQPPSTPSNLRVTSSTATSIGLAWTASTDNVGVAGYDVYLNGVKVWMPSGTSFTYLGLSCATTYTAAVDAYDAAGNHSPKTAITVATPACPDTTPPSTPTGLAASSVSQTSLTLTWNASTDNVGTTGYDIFRNGTKVASVSSTSSGQTGLACGTQYGFGVEAYDATGNRSPRAQLNATTSACPAPQPTAPPPPPPPPPPAGQVLFNGDFDTGNESQWAGIHEYNPARFSVVASDGAVLPRQGSHMARVDIRNEPTSWCSTLSCNVTMAQGGGLPVLGGDSYLGMSVYFPSSFPFSPSSGRWNIFGEWRGPNGAGDQPQAPIHLTVDMNQATPRLSLDLHNNGDHAEDYIAFYGDLPRDQWVDLVVRVNWKNDATGIVEGWMNGVKKFSSGPIKTRGDTVDFVYPMAGFYRAPFASPGVLYIDEFKVGTTLASVTP
jgi:chitodextrinase